ncbi:hypothetical protein [Streptomyces albogriseolus]|uniref:hypothetical protein n=1 Tax=Streptomyces albogriseolus TaxID=1887 RepID=UPI003F4A3F0D
MRKEYPANLERMKPPRRLTLLATLCHVRQTEINDLFAMLRDGTFYEPQPSASVT